MPLGRLLAPEVQELLRSQPELLGASLRDFHPADVTDLLRLLSREEQVRVLESLQAAQLGEVFPYLEGESLKIALNRLRYDVVARGLDRAEPDDAARILTFLPEEKRAKVIAAMAQPAAAGLLTYPPGSAGRLMTSRLVRIRPTWSVGATLEHLRRIDPTVATVASLYVIDEREQLVGVVSLRKLLPTATERLIEDVMTREVVAVSAETPQEDVARLVSQYSFNALPVVGADRRLLGIITVDDVLDVLVERENAAALRLGGVATDPAEELRPFDYFGDPLWRVVRSRIGWLLLLFLAETLTGSVLRHFEGELAKVVALSFFIPLIIGTGGNAGSQTVSTIIRALAVGQITPRDGVRVLFRETASGFLLGALLCIFATLRTLLWGVGFQLALVVGLTMICVCLWANVVGAVVPLAAQRLKIDPTVVSAPLITTVVDATGLAIYLLIARAMLHL